MSSAIEECVMTEILGPLPHITSLHYEQISGGIRPQNVNLTIDVV